MIRIGLDFQDKQKIIEKYSKKHGIKKLYVFYFKKFPIEYDIQGVETEHVEYSDIIMYKYFYRLLEEIDDKSLIVYDGCLRTQKRSDLTYNCAHHYSNQTPHNIVFEYMPFIESVEDFMILLDLETPGKYKGRSFDSMILKEVDIRIESQKLEAVKYSVRITEDDIAKYNAKKEALFDSLGTKDPDTIPRQLHLFSGDLKKKAIKDGNDYVARNNRFNLTNVKAYRDAIYTGKDYIVVDFAHRRLDFIDFMKKTKSRYIRFLSTGLPVDEYYFNSLREWIERIDTFNAQASLYYK